MRTVPSAVILLAIIWALTPTEAFGVTESEEASPDALEYSREFEVDANEAVHRLHLQSTIGQLAELAVESVPSEWAGSIVHHDKEGFSAELLVTSESAMATLELLVSQVDALSNVRVTIRLVPNSLAALEEKVTELVATGGNDRPFDVWIDIPANRIVVDVLESDYESVRLPIEALALEGKDVTSVVVREVDGIAFPTANIYGGLLLSGSGCTSGLTVQKIGSSQRGVAYAGHCADSSYAGIPLNTKGEVFGGSADLKWGRKSGHNYPNKIYYGGGTRNITATNSWNAINIDDWVCHYGRATYYGCGQVMTKTLAPGYVPDAQPRFIRVKDTTSPYVSLGDHGDSGGPWFYSTSAWGIHSGASGPNNHGVNKGIFTSITYMYLVDAYVATS